MSYNLNISDCQCHFCPCDIICYAELLKVTFDMMSIGQQY